MVKYSFKEIRNELKIKGFNFKTNSDSEIIPYAYEVWVINFVKRLNGMFSIAIYDKSKNFFYLIRDRLGIKPLYYYEYNKSLVFASEVNALTKLQLFRNEINLNAVSSYLSFRYPTEDDETFYLGIKRVPAGNILKINFDGKESLVIGKFLFQHQKKF